MDRYVLDCSVAAKWFVPEDLSTTAEEFLVRYEAGDVEFVAPEVIVAELGHTLRRLVATRRLGVSEASSGLTEFLGMRIQRAPLGPLAAQALELAVAHMATFYDALYVALAIREDLKVLTADDGMANSFAPLDRTVRLADLAAS